LLVGRKVPQDEKPCGTFLFQLPIQETMSDSRESEETEKTPPPPPAPPARVGCISAVNIKRTELI